AFTADSLQPLAIPPLALVGNPGAAPSHTRLRGAKLQVTLTTDEQPAYQLTTDHEQLIEVLDGGIRLTSKQATWTFWKGDIFVLPKGFSGRWERIGQRAPRCLRVSRRLE
ncbi:MAG: cupin domain-containing protein, partial [Bacteroidota bacterium]